MSAMIIGSHGFDPWKNNNRNGTTLLTGHFDIFAVQK